MVHHSVVIVMIMTTENTHDIASNSHSCKHSGIQLWCTCFFQPISYEDIFLIRCSLIKFRYRNMEECQSRQWITIVGFSIGS